LGGFALFIGILMVAFWTSAFIYVKMFGHPAELGQAPDDRMLAAVREELEILSDRMMRMEDDLKFFTELHSAPEEASRIGGPSLAVRSGTPAPGSSKPDGGTGSAPPADAGAPDG